VFIDELRSRFGPERILESAPLAPLTTFKVGGSADWLVETKDSDEIVAALRITHKHGIPVTVIGGGSNVLVSDAGVRGLVIRTRGGRIDPIGSAVRAEAAVTINGLVRWTINRGLSGLEAWAGTPGTVGGGVFGNAHFRGRLLGDLIVSVRLGARDGSSTVVPRHEMEFGYDRSRLQRTGEILLSADFRVSAGNPVELREEARRSLAFRKRTQPLETPSAGCIFMNPDANADGIPEGLPASAGALIDRAGLKGAAVGAARVSAAHGNFIVDEGGASARDIRTLIELCRKKVKEKFGVTLHEEIVYLGQFGDPA
jgi:UDP-N-acetylmuramate dehydrogenase